MSAWPQAVWIVRRLQKKIDFPQLLNSYTGLLNNLNDSVNGLYAGLENAEQAIDNLQVSVVTISDTKTNNTPTNNSSGNFTTGTIWLIEDSSS